jgi:hypothetical protein
MSYWRSCYEVFLSDTAGHPSGCIPLTLPRALPAKELWKEADRVAREKGMTATKVVYTLVSIVVDEEIMRPPPETDPESDKPPISSPS